MRRLIAIAVLAFFTGACEEARKVKQGPQTEPATTPTSVDKLEESGPADHNPRDVIERAIQVHGGPLQLGRLQTSIRSEKGELIASGASAPGRREVSMALPNKCRWTFELQAPTSKQVVDLAISGDKGWQAGAGVVKDLTKDEVEDLRAEAHLNWARTLVPLSRNTIELSALPAIMVDKQPALGIKVVSKGNADLRLYFDKQTGYLVKAVRPGREAGEPVVREVLFSEFKDFGGVRLPAKQVELINGVKFAEWTTLGHKPVESLPDATFSKP